MNPRIWLSGRAPTKPSTGWPLSKAMTAGIDWMPSCPAICGCSSMFILTSATFPPESATARSSAGASCLQGPHHGAQKSTSTGCRWEAVSTSARNEAVVTSFTGLAVFARGAAALFAFAICSISAQPEGQRPRHRLLRRLNGGAAQVIQPRASSCPSATINGSCPVARRNFTRSSAREPGRAGVDERVKIEPFMAHHRRVQDDA